MHLMLNSSGAPGPSAEPGARPSRERSHPDPRKAGKPKQLLHRGNANFAKGDYQQALLAYQDLVELKPRGAEGHNNLGATLYKLDRAHDAEEPFAAGRQTQTGLPRGTQQPRRSTPTAGATD